MSLPHGTQIHALTFFRQMNDLKKSQDNQNREELKVLARHHSNKDELQRFDIVPLFSFFFDINIYA